MRILLDECVPVQVRLALPGHEVATTQKMGWSGISNGELLDTAEKAGFDLLIVADRNLQYQQKKREPQLAKRSRRKLHCDKLGGLAKRMTIIQKQLRSALDKAKDEKISRTVFGILRIT